MNHYVDFTVNFKLPDALESLEFAAVEYNNKNKDEKKNL